MNKTVRNILGSALMECCAPGVVDLVRRHPLFEFAVREVGEDLQAFASKDPASGGSPETIARGSSSFKAVAHYRLARVLLEMAKARGPVYLELQANASLVSCRGKLMSGAEIHPNCQIGRRFILDHGCGAVIGETSVLGDDCYVLGGVTLGATGICGNPPGKRHPTLGNRVQVGAFARIFGDVLIGDDVFIGPYCTITQNIDMGSIVTLKSELQIIRQPGHKANPINSSSPHRDPHATI
jgi:serine O-acetyltransferase